MRISDWSSDVCSSDLRSASSPASRAMVESASISRSGTRHRHAVDADRRHVHCAAELKVGRGRQVQEHVLQIACDRDLGDGGAKLAILDEKARRPPARSEEHTSELQSLMRISYAVFC